MKARDRQIEAIEDFLNSPKLEEHTAKEAATFIVDSFYDLITPKEVPSLVTGTNFKLFVSIYHVAWREGDLMWMVNSGSKYGCLADPAGFDKWVEKTSSKYVPSNKLVSVGDRLMYGQTMHVEILAVGDKCFLALEDGKSRPYADSNDNLNKYRREDRKVSLF